MKNILVIPFVAIAIDGSAQSFATANKLTAAHFGNYNLTMLQQINTKLVYAADGGKLKAYPNEKLKYVLSADSIKQLRRRDITVQTQTDVEDPYAFRDSSFVYFEDPENFQQSRIVYAAGKPQIYCLQYIEHAGGPIGANSANDYIFFKWDDMIKYLNTAEVNWLSVATTWADHSSTIDSAFLGGFARLAHRYLDSSLYHLTANLAIPVYATDSLNRTITKDDLSKKLNYEVVVQVQVDPKDPYYLRDSTVQVIYSYDPSQANPIRYRLLWKPSANGYTYDIQSLSSTFEPYAGGIIVPPQPIAYLKIEDVAKQIPVGMLALLKDIIQQDVMLKQDVNLIDDKYIELRGCR